MPLRFRPTHRSIPQAPLFLRFAALAIFAGAVSHAASVEVIPAELRGALQPQVAVAPSGRVDVAFGRKGAVYYTNSRDGITFSPPIKVGELAGLALGMRRGPRIAATDARVTIVAISLTDGNLHAWTSADTGATWQETAGLNDVPGSAKEGLHALAGDGQGRVLAAWLDLRHEATELWSALSRDGGATWQPNTKVYSSPDGHICECCHPSVALTKHGQAAVMWRNWLGGGRDLYLARSQNGGETFSAAEKLGRGTWKLNACPMDGGSLLLQDDGAVSTAWRRDHTIYSTEGFAPEEQQVAEGTQPVLVGQGKARHQVWQNGKVLMTRKQGEAPRTIAPEGRFAAAVPLAGERALVVYETGTGEESTIYADILP